jgi:hypothetical protein
MVRLDSARWQLPWGGAQPEESVRAMTGFSLGREPIPLVRNHAAPLWTADSLTDTVRLSFIDGFTGAVFVLEARPPVDTLRGRVFESWDAGPPFQTPRGSAYAIREACP